MIKALHIATECFPAAKAGGLGDVVGSLPNYFPQEGIEASVVIPKYDNNWFRGQEFNTVFESSFYLNNEFIRFRIQKLDASAVSYPFYCVDIPGKFDRESIYLDLDGNGYRDEIERYLSFQRSVLLWMNEREEQFDIVHCHDHQSGLIPFMMKYCIGFEKLAQTPTVFTIHNAAFLGPIPWSKHNLFPKFKESDGGWLDWDKYIVSLAAAIKCSWKVTTVSPNYLQEIREIDTPIRSLYNDEKEKSVGILNGIDADQWNPKTDEALFARYKKSWKEFKKNNQKKFCETFSLKEGLPIIGFIGRLADQKGADLIPNAIYQTMSQNKNVNFVILGTGDKRLEKQLADIDGDFGGRVKVMLTYNEAIARNIYASSDFLLMPSRFEPCGLNQLFAMRYGSVPIVRITGGLKDTVQDIGDDGGGITFYAATSEELSKAILRGLDLYSQPKWFEKVRKENAMKDYSWNNSIKVYSNIYRELLNK